MEEKNNKLEKDIRRSKRFTIFWFLVALFFAAGVTAMFFVGWWMNRENAKTNNSIENLYRHSFYELCDSMNNMEVVMSKLTLIDDGSYAAELTLSCYRQAEIASTALSIIPVDQYRVQKTEKFLNQVGDWAREYNLALSGKRSIENFSTHTSSLLDTVKSINIKLGEAAVKVNNGYSFRLNYGQSPDFSAPETGNDSGKKENSVEYPELIYDGPFSDSKLQKSYKALDSLKVVTEEEAKAKVAKVLTGLTIENITLIGRGSSDNECYEFTVNTNNGEAYAVISKKGGMPLQILINRNYGTMNLVDDEGLKSIANDFLVKQELKNMTAVWIENSNGIATINFAPKDKGIIYYTDLAKVKLAANGDILGLEMTGYAKNHMDRNMTAKVSQKSARKLVEDKMDISEIRLAVIPLRQSEELCHEIIGKKDGLDFFVYVSANSGEVVNVLRVIDSNQGRLII